MRKYILILALAMPLTAAAQFFDHFEGNELAGHWRFFSEGTQWEYNVSDSMLNVTRLYGGYSGFKQVYIYAQLEPMADFEMTALVGWDEAEFQRLIVIVLRGAGFPAYESLGGFVYETRPSWETPLVTAGFVGGGGSSGQGSRDMGLGVPPHGLLFDRVLRRYAPLRTTIYDRSINGCSLRVCADLTRLWHGSIVRSSIFVGPAPSILPCALGKTLL